MESKKYINSITLSGDIVGITDGYTETKNDSKSLYILKIVIKNDDSLIELISFDDDALEIKKKLIKDDFIIAHCYVKGRIFRSKDNKEYYNYSFIIKNKYSITAQNIQ